MRSLNELLENLGTTPVSVKADPDLLRELIADRTVIVEPDGAFSTIRRKPRAEASLAWAIDADVPIPKANRERGHVYRVLKDLPFDGKTSLFLADRTANSTSSILRRAARVNGHTYTTHGCVREGVRGLRIWRTS